MGKNYISTGNEDKTSNIVKKNGNITFTSQIQFICDNISALTIN